MIKTSFQRRGAENAEEARRGTNPASSLRCLSVLCTSAVKRPLNGSQTWKSPDAEFSLLEVR